MGLMRIALSVMLWGQRRRLRHDETDKLAGRTILMEVSSIRKTSAVLIISLLLNHNLLLQNMFATGTISRHLCGHHFHHATTLFCDI